MKTLDDYFNQRPEEYLAQLHELVNLESPTSDKASVDRLGARVAEELRKRGVRVEILPRQHTGNLILGRLPGVSSEHRILIMCHLDTVWPSGTVEKRPCVVKGERFFGPGAADMKGGIVIALAALKGLQDLGLSPAAEVVLLFTPDEETGSLASYETIVEQARQSRLAICMEPGMADGSLKTARKGVMTFQITTTGRAAHAGADHAAGVNAIEEMAHQILALQAKTDYNLGTTVSVGRIDGGVATNIVSPNCTAWVDVRVTVPEERKRIRQEILALKPRLEGAALEAKETEGRPPMPRDALMVETFRRASQIAARHGLHLTEASTGGASDANLVAEFGIPILDGMGAVGGGLHATDEYVEIRSLQERAKLLGAILTEWEF